jgi:DnaJ domain
MMDHYEELGLERTASTEEIRRAYKRLARLLHPDHCRDEPARQLANLQMKRLNGILAVLTNPAKREIYDRSSSRVPARRQPDPPPQTPQRREWSWAAVGAALVLTGLCLFLLQTPRSTSLQEATSAKPLEASSGAPEIQKSIVRHPAARRPAPRPIVQSAPRNRHVSSESAAEPLPYADPEGVIEPPANVLALAFIPKPVAPVQTIQPAQAPTRVTLAGEWLFVPRTNAKNSDLYPPEYIELRVTQERNGLHGRYRARYRIADQAISPTVFFEFAGPADANGGRFSWTGAGGAQGDVSLRLIDNGALEVTWVATRMGADLGLVSGAATLVRRLE